MIKRAFGMVSLAAAMACCATSAMAAIYEVPVTGTLNGVNFIANLVLNVTDNQVTSSAGSTFTGFGLTNADLALITTSTPYNETAGVDIGYGPVGFRANDGTDLYGADQAFPISAKNGLLFDVGTTTPEFGMFPLLAIAGDPGYSAFTGSVGENEYYVYVGDSNIGPAVEISAGGVPEPSTWAMMLLGFGGLGLIAYRKTRNVSAMPVVAAA